MNRPNIEMLNHDKCRDCDYAVYCYTKPSFWIFRTQEEMERKIAYIESCPIRRNMIKSNKKDQETKISSIQKVST
ncbi:MAG: hypothetical protein N2260_04860 [Syntrophobacterales bacterium]|nr:hypothetical protein [Syntrophobacterales bacterium]